MTAHEQLSLGPIGPRLFKTFAVIGVAGAAAAVALGYLQHDGFRRFQFVYLVSFCFFLTVTLGALFFVLLQHVTHAGWSVSVRRVAEDMAATLPILAVLAIPIAVWVLSGKGQLYHWAQPLPAHSVVHSTPAPAAHDKPAIVPAPEEGLDAALIAKRPFLNPPFFVIRLAIYFALWSALALWYRKQSILQDRSGDPQATRRMEKLAAPALVAYGLTVTFASFDLLMSLDAHWYSTIFGVYIFAGCVVGVFASLILAIFLLQRAGRLTHSITIEHYHDLGKFLFGFVFFWGYIAFSQYMLIWYANIPEETAWMSRHGMTTATGQMTAWTAIAVLLLFVQLLIPFAGLISRHVKRNPYLLSMWAVWLLVAHWIDLYWLVMPEYGPFRPHLMDLAALAGLGGIVMAAFVRLLGAHALRPTRDPRLEEALTFENI